ncbi:MAG: hypothetical protein LC115_01465 [Bacteroidia bacterium]|nr:hypothetical protein [Bacteroidia bacterium]
MKYYNLILVSVFTLFISNRSYSQPDSSVINKQVKIYYAKKSLADGSPTYSIENIKIIEITISSKDTFLVKVNVSGTYQNHSIPDEEREHDFEHKRIFIFYQNSKKNWECELQYE